MSYINNKVVKYIVMPEILPRCRALFSSGFSYAAFFIASIFGMSGLLPKDHPYLNPHNISRFGLRNVMSEAGSRLVWKKENIDQIAIYFLILTGIAMLALQIVMLVMGGFTQFAYAQMPSNYADFFVTQYPEHDLAFVMMDRVFGVQGIFNSCVTMGTPCFNSRLADPLNPAHEALHAMLRFYSIGMMVVAALIIAYYVMAVIAETAESGQNFGSRFSHVWAPIRLVVALGLLIPLGSGLNSAQYITLYAAKFGSGFATNGWLLFINTATNSERTLLGEHEYLVVTPNAPDVNELVVFFSAVATCVQAELELRNDRNIEAYLMNPIVTQPPATLRGTDFNTARTSYYGRVGANGAVNFESTSMLIYFGSYDPAASNMYASRIQNVEPTCGSLQFDLTDVSANSPGSYMILEGYYELIREMWKAAKGEGSAHAMGSTVHKVGMSAWMRATKQELGGYANYPMPTSAERNYTIREFKEYMDGVIQDSILLQRESETWLEDLRPLGWGGAAIWYNKIAELNGTVITATHNLPVVMSWPLVMEEIATKKGATAQNMSLKDRFRPVSANGDPIKTNNTADMDYAKALHNSVSEWDETGGRTSGNAFVDVVNSIFGTEGLFNMAENDLQGIHPLAQLVGVGRSIITRSINNLGNSAFGFAVATIANITGATGISSIGSAASGMFTSIALLGITIGFLLFYLIPFMPFMYFFFAMVGWVKTIFEAMVGVPLWALAHIKIDGPGLPGTSAMTGYYLILDVFLRPILIVFGLLASVTIFAAQVRVLHELWPVVVSNVSGFDRDTPPHIVDEIFNRDITEMLRSPIDQLFYTVIYTVIVFMLGNSSFKLVDLIPNNILRWMGASAQTFADESGTQADVQMRSAFMGSQFISSNLQGAAANAKGALGGGIEAGRQLIK
jgi:conjugal transfer/type IV secretion protein DotA/TraY